MSTAPLSRPFPYAAGHPANHGYVQCARCDTWRLPIHTNTVPSEGAVVRHCVDVPWCSEQAKATGRLEGP